MGEQNIEEIYQKYSNQVFKFLICLTNNDSLAEELTQETFYLAVKNIDKFRGDSKISVWLCQIAKNLWYKELRKNKKICENPIEDYNESLIFESNIENNIIDNENKKNMYKSLQQLDDRSREVIYLRLTGELTFKEIAEILNKNENWVRVTFYRGKQKILKESDFYEKR